MGITRWDPKSRAGAVLVRTKAAFDVQAASKVSDTVRDWADYQKLGGEHDNAETSPVQGNYDWRSYIQEEAQLAKRREEKSPKKAERAPPAPAPSIFYV